MADEKIINTTPPHDSNAERNVIGSMLMDREAISEASAILNKEDFYDPQYGIIYEAIVQLYNAGKAVDEILLGEQLRQNGAPKDIYELSYLGDIMASVSVSTFVSEYANIVKEKAYARSLIKLAESVAKRGYEGKEPVDRIYEDAESNIFKLMQQRSGSKDYAELKDIIIDVVNEIEAATQTRGKINGLRTGFINLDNMLTGMHGGELILVAARPSMGKTAFVLNIAHHVAIRENVPVVFFSLEMGKEQLGTRLIAVDSMVDAKSLKTGDIKDNDWDNIFESADRLSGAKIFIDDNSSITMAELRTKCRRLKQTENIGLIVIDYLQLMSSPNKVESRQLFIAEVSRALKSLARELNVPVIALSQLNRAVDSRPDHKPVLADLRESGAIEQDADVVMFIYRDDYYNEASEKPGVAEIIVAKQRNGATGPVELAWLSRFTKFANLAPPKKEDNAENA